MTTLNQKTVIDRIKRKVGKGRISIGPEMKGIYADSVVKNPKKLTGSKAYKKEMKPILERLTEHRNKVLKTMDEKDLTQEQYKTLGEELARINHDIQLLGGGDTERQTIKFQLDSDIIEKNADADSKNNSKGQA